MKKTLIALAMMVVFATTSFAGVSFLTAPGIGEGNIGVLGFYGTNHVGPATHTGMDTAYDLSYKDLTNLGIRGCYGLMKDLDLLAAYSFDTMTGLKKMAADYTDMLGAETSVKQQSANSFSLGAKYTVLKETKDIPVDVAVAGGYENSVQLIKVKPDGFTGKEIGYGVTTYAIAGIVSKKIDNMVPYGAIAYKALTQHAVRGQQDATPGSSFALNLGLMYGIADNMAIAGEYNIENQAWAETKTRSSGKTRAYHNTVSGISLGFAYLFNM